ncbi:endonuclease/exonuclease/phosphatase family protein [Roseibium salinum]|uniref:Endonuclease/exonuclease/phosphatase family protein n=1 Tax=Roseibium salinum TaxID=1604349 RepID=A0ABT3QXJ2_9HYPH|nr:endonuclease/exonuclease/phosphatase family protein [Roseibium sp. DSM 29163]MCX2721659.1 endonuclease/exonuclease/phosphatase family protein [Roseibium sp. DSM 29163]
MLFRSSRPRRPLLVSLLSLVCWCGCLGALAVSAFGLMSFAAPDYWVADNMSFFLRQFLAAGLAGCLAGAVGLLLRHRFAMLYRTLWFCAFLAFLGLAGLTAARTMANTVDTAAQQEGRRPVKVISINIEHLFLGDAVLQAFLERENPDVVVMQEVLWGLQKLRWERLGLPAGGAGKNGFPAHLKIGELGGLVVYSRFPVLKEDSRVIQGELPSGSTVYYDADRELLALTLDTGAKPLHLVAIHPDSPRSESRWKNKRRYFDEVDRLVRSLQTENSGNILAIGDWNSAPWSARFQQTLEENGLSTAYPGGFPQTTRFFFHYRLHWILGAPVDQFAVSGGVQVTDVSLGPHIGSDHLPLIVELALEDVQQPAADPDPQSPADPETGESVD